MLNFLPQTVQIEVVSDVFLINFAKELVAFQIYEPLNPAVPSVTLTFVVHGTVLRTLLSQGLAPIVSF